MEEFPSPRNLNFDRLILNSKLFLVIENDDRLVPITKQILEFRFSQSKLSNPDQWEVFQYLGRLYNKVSRNQLQC